VNEPGAVKIKRIWEDIYSPERREPRSMCRAQDCTNSTTEKKPYCGTHLSRLPYCRKIMNEVQGIANELALVGQKGPRALDPYGILAQDVVDAIGQHGALPARRVPLAVGLTDAGNDKTWESILAALEKAGRIQILLLGSRRGSLRKVVRLPSGPVVLKNPDTTSPRRSRAKIKPETVCVTPALVSKPENLAVVYARRLAALTALIASRRELKTATRAFLSSQEAVRNAEHDRKKASQEVESVLSSLGIGESNGLSDL
jgi:hypothetical protein